MAMGVLGRCRVLKVPGTWDPALLEPAEMLCPAGRSGRTPWRTAEDNNAGIT